MKRIMIISFLAMFATGCATPKYGCGLFPRTGCQPVSQVYQETNGELDDYREHYFSEDVDKNTYRVGNGRTKKTRNSKSNYPTQNSTAKGDVNITVAQATNLINYISPGDAILTKPKELRILVRPWEDSDRDLHMGGFVYIRLGEPEWLILQ